MAKIVGGITTSHIPAIGIAMAKGLQEDPYWKPFFDGYKPIQAWLENVKPDIAVIVYNDHGLNFFLDTVPTFAIGAAPHYQNEDEGWGIPVLPTVQGNPEFSWHLIESVMAEEFDLTMCQEMVVDHGLMIPMTLMWDHTKSWPVEVVPLAVNVVQHPLPTAQRCYKLGQALGRAIEAYGEDKKVVVFGTGGMSHQLQGERSGFINKEFDRMFMDKMVDDPEALAKLTMTEFLDQSGSEGAELIMWLVMRGALSEKVNLLHSNYHVPISNTAAGVMLLENTD
ncbi:MAG: protocatechuate 3,4-dioxygenase [Rhodospirillales bacterium]|nr:protocatechuate 3,4-dioxygenase [Rhodospirillales bacterium]